MSPHRLWLAQPHRFTIAGDLRPRSGWELSVVIVEQGQRDADAHRELYRNLSVLEVAQVVDAELAALYEL